MFLHQPGPVNRGAIFLRFEAMKRAPCLLENGTKFSLRNSDRAVIIAMASVLMMQVAIDEIIDMIAVRNGGVTTVLSVDVISRMTGAGMA
jgi:hypothetical protein